ncbi:efflux RND transporter periplasmic adaptor subunit [Caenimonas sedimenti]|uniref:Efflux RND transporter periplasmic adaptor subunit n=1 Tax=Caenimonas sedimenti TaxID=2596921 RepID=A0A562ZXI4_9BURK|nr:efflux RND transporter periplasmic adaptor subunit [Caenimonas sedimenti]TWO73330.1 efflux RND transporter periplasmic adaptor subunit [Caenimonas sedimenti]
MAVRLPRILPVFLVLAAGIGLTACGKGSSTPAAGAAAPPPPEVGVVTVATGEVGVTTELPGRLEASRVAQVRARAAGIVQERLFREGSDVKAGQPLFRIDPAPYAAAQAAARATLARAEANLGLATATAERYKPLVEANAISKQEYANAVAAQKQAEAEVAAGRAAVQTAGINLSYASVTAPISGRIGRALVTKGALVGQGEATPLAIVQQIHPLYVNFTQSASEALALRRAMAEGRLKRATGGGEAAQVRVLLEDGSEYPQPGKLLFSDLTVDPSSGQVTLRAEVPNVNGVLLPGLYVRVRLEVAKASNAVLLPQQAVSRTSTGDTVMVVGADGKVAPRPVKLGGNQGTQWVVLEGLKAGEQVMVDGFQKLRPNAPVKPVPWSASGAARPASAPASAAKS